MLLDSTELIDFERRKPETRAAIREFGQHYVLGSCPITVAELYAGRSRGSDPALDAFLDSLEYWDITYDDAIRAGQYRWQFARQGTQLSTTDTLIAAVAARLGAVILTGNVKDYPMDDVAVQSLLT